MNKLKEPALRELPMGSIKADGWIESQLRGSLAALAGEQQGFYDYIKEGTFTGGKQTYSFLNESQPYYFQAGVAAIFSIRDPPQGLQDWVENFLEYVIKSQDSSTGWFGPEPNILWPRWPVLIGAIHYAEAKPEKAERIIDFIYKFVHATHSGLISKRPNASGLDLWGAVRTAEYTFILQWLYEHHPGDEAMQELLLNDMTLIRIKGNEAFGDFNCQGWPAFFSEENFNKDGFGPQTYRSHGVNLAMALKESALRWRISGKEEDRKESRHQWDIVYAYHGKAAGHFSADEHLAGLSPERGAETCLVVELMWSSSLMYSIFGENQDADRVERLAFNSLPAAMAGDWWGRQYDQQENQLSSQNFKTNPFRDNDEDSNVFGLQTNYPCCTVNHPQGLPRFISRAYLHQHSNGDVKEMLLHVYLIPSTVKTVLGNENHVTISAETNYPFEDTIRYTFHSKHSFTFGVRIPHWSKSVQFRKEGDNWQKVQPNHKDIFCLIVPSGLSKMDIRLTSTIQVTQANGAEEGVVHISKGALLYCLPLPYTTKEIRKDSIQPKAIDLARLPTNPKAWKVAIDVGTVKFEDKGNASKGKALPFPIFDDGKAPGVIKVQACSVEKGWDPIDDGQWNQGFPPGNVPASKDLFEVELEPYGAAKLRVTCFPTIKRNERQRMK